MKRSVSGWPAFAGRRSRTRAGKKTRVRRETGRARASRWGWAGAQASRSSETGRGNHLEGSQQSCLATSWASCRGFLQGAPMSLYYPIPVAVIIQLGGAQADSLL